jgi:hypothetical protein
MAHNDRACIGLDDPQFGFSLVPSLQPLVPALLNPESYKEE